VGDCYLTTSELYEEEEEEGDLLWPDRGSNQRYTALEASS